jgi:hypothetical protein
MNCCTASQCKALDETFDQKYAEGDLKRYQKKGPEKTTRVLLDAVRAQLEITGRTLIDIGGGVGVIQHELFKTGLAQATGVDASAAFLKTATQVALERGYGEKVAQHLGDFVAIAPGLAPADIVTLERVICCYPDMQALVARSAEHARRVYGVVIPRDEWWMRIAQHVLNFVERLRGDAFRFFVHPRPAIDALVAANGLRPCFERNVGVWQVVVYRAESS